MAYDDAGGFYDHVVPPADVPADGSPCVVPGEHPKCRPSFDFRRLGLRSSAMLISPWVGEGAARRDSELRALVARSSTKSRDEGP